MSREALNALLRDLPPELRRAVKDAVARCRPQYRPRLYAHDWLEELYHEAACAACEVQRGGGGQAETNRRRRLLLGGLCL